MSHNLDTYGVGDASRHTQGKLRDEVLPVRDAHDAGLGVISKSFVLEQHPLRISSLLILMPAAILMIATAIHIMRCGSLLSLSLFGD